jgi:hypothetical protein
MQEYFGSIAIKGDEAIDEASLPSVFRNSGFRGWFSWSNGWC